ncbi:hypothetical protein [Psychrobacter sp. NC44]|uniref:hypothetical protein n=1 Tax=Psychrobacter sp. NC44 TaxID=2774130 RepID=UPI0019184C7C|nr:hypothetical protein [Psychrobacter sp. NC44]
MLDKTISDAIQKTNLQLKNENHIQNVDSQLLMKKGSNVSSLGLAIFISTLENEIYKETGFKIKLIDALNTGADVSFLEDIGKLKAYLSKEIK